MKKATLFFAIIFFLLTVMDTFSQDLYALPYPFFYESDREISEIELSALKDMKPGDEFTFGVYEQDNNMENGWEPIEWFVLAVEDGRTLVLSKFALDAKPFHEKNERRIIWENSHIREWLNGAFYDNVFSPAEKNLIARSINTNPDNKVHEMITGSSQAQPDTIDNIFLLDHDEAKGYYAEISAVPCVPTEYTKSKSPYAQYTIESMNWWLRSPGENAGSFEVNYGYSETAIINIRRFYMVRPAFWLQF